MYPEREAEYRRLATEARATALAAMDAYDKRTYLLVAQRYDVLAERARRRDDADARFGRAVLPRRDGMATAAKEAALYSPWNM